MNEQIAQTEYLCKLRNGSVINITVKIGKPYPYGDGDMACPVIVDGLNTRLPDAVGVDAVSALRTAIDMARSVLQIAIDSGGLIYYPYDLELNGENAIPLSHDTLL